MYPVFIIFICITINGFYSEPIEEHILNYFKTASTRNGNIAKIWELHRKPLENAIESVIKETIGTPGMNVYIRKVDDILSTGYLHDDNQVKLILKDLVLDEIPRFFMPDVQFSLTSNVLKIKAALARTFVHAEYAVVRNKSDIIYETIDQNPLKSSPFLFQQVRDTGTVAISIEGCTFLGFIMTMLTGESINLGYQRFKLINCRFAIEIYKIGDGSPAVSAEYLPFREDNGISIHQLLLKPIYDELVPKMQGAMFTFVNTSSIFGSALVKFRSEQARIIEVTAQLLAELVRQVNKITIQKNQGTVKLEDYVLSWKDENDLSPKEPDQQLMIKDLIVTGLDTLYSAHIGGPYKLDDLMIGEELRFSSVQVHGNIFPNAAAKSKQPFFTEFADLSVDLQLHVSHLEEAKIKQIKGRRRRDAGPVLTFKSVEPTSFRKVSFGTPSMLPSSAEALVTGYLLSAVPKALVDHLKSIIPQALKEMPEVKGIKPKLVPETPNTDEESAEIITDSGQRSDSKCDGSLDESPDELQEDEHSTQEDEEASDRNVNQLKHEIDHKNPFPKYKKRFKSFLSMRGQLQQNIEQKSKDRVVDNQINKTK